MTLNVGRANGEFAADVLGQLVGMFGKPILVGLQETSSWDAELAVAGWQLYRSMGSYCTLAVPADLGHEVRGEFLGADTLAASRWVLSP